LAQDFIGKITSGRVLERSTGMNWIASFEKGAASDKPEKYLGAAANQLQTGLAVNGPGQIARRRRRRALKNDLSCGRLLLKGSA
jgi:hypothetical protein